MGEANPLFFDSLEALVLATAEWLKLVVESIGIIVIALGVLVATYRFVRLLLSAETTDFQPIRLILARYLALALEFQLGADILATAIAPTWDSIGQLGAIAVIRTGLNFFLMREMESDKAKAEKT
jgi:uncharacterized membrane protein